MRIVLYFKFNIKHENNFLLGCDYMNKKNNNDILKLMVLILALFTVGICGATYYLVSNNVIQIQKSQIENSYVNLGDFSVKLKDENRNRYFQGRIYVGYDKDDSKAKKELTKQKQIPIINDTINSYLRNKDYEFLNDVNNKEQIKKEMIDQINKQLQTCKITDIRFYNYLLQ